MDAKKKLEALTSGAEGDSEQTEDWPPAEEFNAMLDEVAGSVSADAYEDDDWMDETDDENSSDDTLPAGEMELIFENVYIM